MTDAAPSRESFFALYWDHVRQQREDYNARQDGGE